MSDVRPAPGLHCNRGTSSLDIEELPSRDPSGPATGFNCSLVGTEISFTINRSDWLGHSSSLFLILQEKKRHISAAASIQCNIRNQQRWKIILGVEPGLLPIGSNGEDFLHLNLVASAPPRNWSPNLLAQFLTWQDLDNCASHCHSSHTAAWLGSPCSPNHASEVAWDLEQQMMSLEKQDWRPSFSDSLKGAQALSEKMLQAQKSRAE